VTWWTGWRADLARPETTIDRRQLPLLVGGATAIVVVAQTTDPGTTGELLLVVAAAVGFLLCAAVARLPRALIAVLVTVLLTTAMWREGNLEVALFPACS
jgi:hypothetical protein